MEWKQSFKQMAVEQLEICKQKENESSQRPYTFHKN